MLLGIPGGLYLELLQPKLYRPAVPTDHHSAAAGLRGAHLHGTTTTIVRGAAGQVWQHSYSLQILIMAAGRTCGTCGCSVHVRSFGRCVGHQKLVRQAVPANTMLSAAPTPNSNVQQPHCLHAHPGMETIVWRADNPC